MGTKVLAFGFSVFLLLDTPQPGFLFWLSSESLASMVPSYSNTHYAQANAGEEEVADEPWQFYQAK
jgi:hypothetical protein